MTLKELINEGKQILCDAGIESCESDAKILAMDYFRLDYSGLFFEGGRNASDREICEYRELIKKRATHFPCQYITGCQDFMGYTFSVRQEVLIPRPETELLVEAALEQMKGRTKVKALDMCCGSGCIGLSFRKRREAAGHLDEVFLSDVSFDAIALSGENSDRLGAGAVHIIQSDLFENISQGEFDIIMSNPPYISTEDMDKIMVDVKEYEPRLALDGGEDGLFFYRKIVRELDSYLAKDGIVMFEIGYNQYKAVKAMLNNAGFLNVRLIKDYSGLDRVVIAGR